MFRKADEPKIRVLSCSQDLGLASGDTASGLGGSLCSGEGVVSILHFLHATLAVVTAAFCDISLPLSALSLDFGSLGHCVLCSAMCTMVLDGPLTGSANGHGHGRGCLGQ